MRVFDVVKKLQDLTYLAWDEKTITSGTGGTFLKSRRDTERGPVYYKLSCYDRYRGIYGHESVNELIASRLLDHLQMPHVPYKLIHGLVEVDGVEHETWLSTSRDYRTRAERRQAFDTFYELNAKPGESPLEFCGTRGWGDQIAAMMAFDYLIANRDRHGANLEVSFREGDVTLAPLFDHGVSFVFSCYGDEARAAAFDALTDVAAQNYFGTRSLSENLQFVPPGIFSAEAFDGIDEWLFAGLDGALPAAHRAKIREILDARWNHLHVLGIVRDK